MATKGISEEVGDIVPVIYSTIALFFDLALKGVTLDRCGDDGRRQPGYLLLTPHGYSR